jgi:hypothetical protein
MPDVDCANQRCVGREAPSSLPFAAPKKRWAPRGHLARISMHIWRVGWSAMRLVGVLQGAAP